MEVRIPAFFPSLCLGGGTMKKFIITYAHKKNLRKHLYFNTEASDKFEAVKRFNRYFSRQAVRIIEVQEVPQK